MTEIMKKLLALLAASVGLFWSGAMQAAEIQLQRNAPALIDGVLYPVSGRPLVMPDMEVVLAAFATTQSEVNAVANLTDRSVVNVIVIDPMVAANLEALVAARAENRTDVDRTQAAISSNAILRSDLESRRVDIAILAVDIAPNGVLVIYALA
jgi:hypothetical protein